MFSCGVFFFFFGGGGCLFGLLFFFFVVVFFWGGGGVYITLYSMLQMIAFLIRRNQLLI